MYPDGRDSWNLMTDELEEATGSRRKFLFFWLVAGGFSSPSITAAGGWNRESEIDPREMKRIAFIFISTQEEGGGERRWKTLKARMGASFRFH